MGIKYEAAINAMNKARKAEREKVIEETLNLIDQYTKATFLPDGGFIDTIEDVEGLRDAIEDLKEGEQE